MVDLLNWRIHADYRIVILATTAIQKTLKKQVWQETLETWTLGEILIIKKAKDNHYLNQVNEDEAKKNGEDAKRDDSIAIEALAFEIQTKNRKQLIGKRREKENAGRPAN